MKITKRNPSKFILEYKKHTYLQTKTPHNFGVIDQNGMIQSFPQTYNFIKPFSNFYF